MMVKISSNLLVNADEVCCVIDYASNASKALHKSASDNNKLINLTRGRSARSLICLNNGTVISLNIKVETLLKKFINKDESE